MHSPFKATGKGKPFLGIRFANCACYGRLYLNDEKTAYVGRCPRCGRAYQIKVGPGGTSERMFIAYC